MTSTKYQKYNKLLGYNLFTEIGPEKVYYNSYLPNDYSVIDLCDDGKYKGNIEKTNISTRYRPYSPDPVQLDQFNKADGGKPRVDLLFSGAPLALLHIAAVLSYGAEKYEDNGWKLVESNRYRDAKGRHLLETAIGEEDYDDESGLLHIAHEACNAIFLLHQKLEELGNPRPKWNKPPRNHRK